MFGFGKYKVDGPEILKLCAFIGVDTTTILEMINPIQQDPGWSTNLNGGKVKITPVGDGLFFEIEVIYRRYTTNWVGKGAEARKGDSYTFINKYTRKVLYSMLEIPPEIRENVILFKRK